MSVIEYVMFLNVPFMRATKKKKTKQPRTFVKKFLRLIKSRKEDLNKQKLNFFHSWEDLIL